MGTYISTYENNPHNISKKKLKIYIFHLFYEDQFSKIINTKEKCLLKLLFISVSKTSPTPILSVPQTPTSKFGSKIKSSTSPKLPKSKTTPFNSKSPPLKSL